MINNTILKANTVIYHFQPLFPAIENLLCYQRLNIFFLLLFREMITCQLLSLYHSLQATLSDRSVVIRDKLIQVQSMNCVIFHYLQPTKIKIFPVSKSTIRKITLSSSPYSVEKSKEVLVLKVGKDP